MNRTIGIDLGGTFIKGALCDEHGTIQQRHALPTEGEGGYVHVLGRIEKLVNELLDLAHEARTSVRGIGIGAPGPMCHAEGIIHAAPNLPGFVNVPLGRDMEARVKVRVVLENDANAAAFGEFTAGAGRNVRSLVMLTLGTGVGGGVVLDRRLWRGDFDNAGEVGHMILVPGGRACPCGQQGCFERYASANAVAERLAEAVAAGEPSTLADRVRGDLPFDARDVHAAAAAGDTLARRIWDETCLYLATGIVNLQHLLNPQLVVLAGGLINAGDELLGPIRAHFDRLSWTIAPDRPRIALATLGTDAGTIGAAMLAR